MWLNTCSIIIIKLLRCLSYQYKYYLQSGIEQLGWYSSASSGWQTCSYFDKLVYTLTHTLYS
jgi:hypothetical protein